MSEGTGKRPLPFNSVDLDPLNQTNVDIKPDKEQLDMLITESLAPSLDADCPVKSEVTSDDDTETDVNGAQDNAQDSTAAVKVLCFNDAYEQFFNEIGISVSQVKYAGDVDGASDRRAKVIYATGHHVMDYYLELYCLTTFLRIILETRQTSYNYDQWLTRSFTDALNVIEIQNTRKIVKYVDRSKRSEYIQMKENFQIKCKVTVESLTTCLRHIPHKNNIIKRLAEIEQICRSQNKEIDLKDDGNFFTAMLNEVNGVLEG